MQARAARDAVICGSIEVRGRLRSAFAALCVAATVGPAAPAAAEALGPRDPAGPAATAEKAPEPLATGRAGYRALIERESARAGLPPEIAEAVMAVESGYDPSARGGVGEVGLMQVLPSTARMMGFTGGDADLADPATNIRYGVTYLAGAWRLGGQDICTAAMKYRAGHGETRFSQLSVSYCLAVRAKLAARGYAVTGSVPVATFGFAPSASFGPRGARSLGSCRGFCLKGVSGGADVAELNKRLESIVFSVKTVAIPRR